MFDDIKPGHQIKRLAGVGQSFSRALFHIFESARAAKIERFARNVYPLGLAKLRKRFKIPARATSDVENA